MVVGVNRGFTFTDVVTINKLFISLGMYSLGGRVSAYKAIITLAGITRHLII